jgi:hypothetical protein
MTAYDPEPSGPPEDDDDIWPDSPGSWPIEEDSSPITLRARSPAGPGFLVSPISNAGSHTRLTSEIPSCSVGFVNPKLTPHLHPFRHTELHLLVPRVARENRPRTVASLVGSPRGHVRTQPCRVPRDRRLAGSVIP